MTGSSADFLLRLQTENQKQKFTEQVQTITNRCFDICFQEKRFPAKMDGYKSECVANCVNRLIDASEFMVNSLQNNPNIR